MIYDGADVGDDDRVDSDVWTDSVRHLGVVHAAVQSS
jgi:hypothetical protein